jgi:hypothetical protein
VRRTATPDVAQHAPSLYVVSDVERAGRPGPQGITNHKRALDSHAERADSDAVKRVRGEWCAGLGLLSSLRRIASRCGRQGKAKEYSHFA